ncbi:3-keto-disaccharide hydrolase [Catalinimonas niigatensis]|uniref:3-keto-disaccharide hydrolase n=1 Tax=Catalinimonas niigatensis TaxID=1397264 RepID=UPI0026653459|nr:DUF1080 domain-containing protein [Catalinimonas niigatensis]WPP51255.1 DUF1080 domain-containing protein [Catalinimonas niigatensis]
MILAPQTIAVSFLLLLMLTFSCQRRTITKPLFNGETLQGWEGDPDFFRVKDGAIVAGRLTDLIPQNEFLCTVKEYGDFELRLKVKLVGEGSNGGIQFRSQRIPESHEVAGYQADIGFIPSGWVQGFAQFRGRTESLNEETPYPLWGSLYDESRRARILDLADRKLVMATLKPDDWNEIRIRAEQKQIKIWLNNQLTTEYTEEEDVPQEGIIGLQVHSGPPLEVWYKDIFIQEL